jgi:CDGSH-type Zn-finger protein
MIVVVRLAPFGEEVLQHFISGTGRVVARVESARLCRCGGSGTRPFCDGTHARHGCKS